MDSRADLYPIFKWYDVWIGLFWDRERKWLYIFPMPCLGFVIQFDNFKEI